LARDQWFAREIHQRDGADRRERMVARHDRDEARRTDDERCELGVGFRHHAERGVEAALAQQPQLSGRRSGLHRDDDVRVAALEFRGRAHHDVTEPVRMPERELHDLMLRIDPRPRVRSFHGVERRLRVDREAFTERREGDPSRGAVEQRAADLVFEAADALAHRGLREVQFLGGAPEVQVPRDGEEALELAEIHRPGRYPRCDCRVGAPASGPTYGPTGGPVSGSAGAGTRR